MRKRGRGVSCVMRRSRVQSFVTHLLPLPVLLQGLEVEQRDDELVLVQLAVAVDVYVLYDHLGVVVADLVAVLLQAANHLLLRDEPVVIDVELRKDHRQLPRLLELQVLESLRQNLPLQPVEGPMGLKLLDHGVVERRARVGVHVEPRVIHRLLVGEPLLRVSFQQPGAQILELG